MSADRMPDLSAIDVEIGRLLKEYRLSRGMSQERLAELLDMPLRKLQYAEGGTLPLTGAMIAVASEALQISPEHLIPDQPFVARWRSLVAGERTPAQAGRAAR